MTLSAESRRTRRSSRARTSPSRLPPSRFRVLLKQMQLLAIDVQDRRTAARSRPARSRTSWCAPRRSSASTSRRARCAPLLHAVLGRGGRAGRRARRRGGRARDSRRRGSRATSSTPWSRTTTTTMPSRRWLRSPRSSTSSSPSGSTQTTRFRTDRLKKEGARALGYQRFRCDSYRACPEQADPRRTRKRVRHQDRGLTLATGSTTGRGLYVGMTRGRQSNHVLGVTGTDDFAEVCNILEQAVTAHRADIPAVPAASNSSTTPTSTGPIRSRSVDRGARRGSPHRRVPGVSRWTDQRA